VQPAVKAVPPPEDSNHSDVSSVEEGQVVEADIIDSSDSEEDDGQVNRAIEVRCVVFRTLLLISSSGP
jgi:hypothetical protein